MKLLQAAKILRVQGCANLYSNTTNQEAIRSLFRVINRYVGNLPPMPAVFPDYPAPVVRNAGDDRELTMMRWGMPPPPRTGGPPVTNILNTSSPHWRGWPRLESRCRHFTFCASELLAGAASSD
jgi:putative SOS response-associated peptidase YedK